MQASFLQILSEIYEKKASKEQQVSSCTRAEVVARVLLLLPKSSPCCVSCVFSPPFQANVASGNTVTVDIKGGGKSKKPCCAT